MTRTKNFSRDMVLQKALPLFWRKGFVDTSIKDLEAATGVNKSGLYSEFKDKDDLFAASLDYYAEHRGNEQVLNTIPFGWNNIDTFFRSLNATKGTERGCFIIFSMREFEVLSPKTRKKLRSYVAVLRELLAQNVAAEQTKMSSTQLAEMLLVFFSGLALNDNLPDNRDVDESIESILRVVKEL